MVSLDYSIYKIIAAEIVRWIEILKAIDRNGNLLQAVE